MDSRTQLLTEPRLGVEFPRSPFEWNSRIQTQTACRVIARWGFGGVRLVNELVPGSDDSSGSTTLAVGKTIPDLVFTWGGVPAENQILCEFHLLKAAM